MTNSIKDKIKKLLALAEGQANENESARAMELASSLMMKHGIEEAELKDAPKATVVAGDWMDIHYDWYKVAAQAVGLLFGTKMVMTRPFGKTKAKMQFVGRSNNIEASEETFAFILLQVEQLYKTNLPKGMSQTERGKYRKTFKLACATRIYHRCAEIVGKQEEEKKLEKSTGTALVISEHREVLRKEIEDYFSDAGIKSVKQRAKKYSHGAAAAAGYSAGNSVDLNKKL